MLGRGRAASEDREGLGLLGVIFVADMIGVWAAAIVVDAIVAVISSRVLLVRPWLYATSHGRRGTHHNQRNDSRVGVWSQPRNGGPKTKVEQF